MPTPCASVEGGLPIFFSHLYTRTSASFLTISHSQVGGRKVKEKSKGIGPVHLPWNWWKSPIRTGVCVEILLVRTPCMCSHSHSVLNVFVIVSVEWGPLAPCRRVRASRCNRCFFVANRRNKFLITTRCWSGVDGERWLRRELRGVRASIREPYIRVWNMCSSSTVSRIKFEEAPQCQGLTRRYQSIFL